MVANRTVFAFITSAVAAVALSLWTAHASAEGVPTERMDAHMEVTVRSSPAPGDRARADAILAAARSVMAQYPTPEAAEKAGFAKFLPRLSLPIEHFTNNAYAVEAWSGFNPNHPTSLIFKRDGAQLRLVGVMYTARRNADLAELNDRVPLSVAMWHRHVAFCAGPAGTSRDAYLGPQAKFGLLGSISSKDACDAAGGTFLPVVFGWMVHVWATESEPAKIWAVDPEGSMSHASGMGDHMEGMGSATQR